jgi:hypothetical protein
MAIGMKKYCPVNVNQLQKNFTGSLSAEADWSISKFIYGCREKSGILRYFCLNS